MPTPVAVAEPALTMLTKAVAVAPTCTERLTGRTAATSGCCGGAALEVTRSRNEIWLTHSPSVAVTRSVHACSTPVAFTGGAQVGLWIVGLLKLPDEASVGHDAVHAYCTVFACESSTVTATPTVCPGGTGFGVPPVLLMIEWLWPDESTLIGSDPVVVPPLPSRSVPVTSDVPHWVGVAAMTGQLELPSAATTAAAGPPEMKPMPAGKAPAASEMV